MRYSSIAVALAAIAGAQAQNSTAPRNSTAAGMSTVTFTPRCPSTTQGDTTRTRAAVPVSGCASAPLFTAIYNSNGGGGGSNTAAPPSPQSTVTYTTTQLCGTCPIQTGVVVGGTVYISGTPLPVPTAIVCATCQQGSGTGGSSQSSCPGPQCPGAQSPGGGSPQSPPASPPSSPGGGSQSPGGGSQAPGGGSQAPAGGSSSPPSSPGGTSQVPAGGSSSNTNTNTNNNSPAAVVPVPAGNNGTTTSGGSPPVMSPYKGAAASNKIRGNMKSLVGFVAGLCVFAAAVV